MIGGGLAHWALASPVGLGILPELAGRGSTAGLVAIIGLSAMTLVAMLRMIPYHIWKASHTLLRKLVPARLVEVERVIPFDGGVDVTFRSKKPMPKFQPGQLAMLSHKSLRAEAYPFTIAGGDEMVRRLSSVPLGIGPIILSPRSKFVIRFALAAQWDGSCRRLTASEKNSFGSLVVLVSRRFFMPLSVCSQMLGPV